MKQPGNDAKNTYSRGQLRLIAAFGSYLGNAGYEISRARNLAEGLRKALAERPDLIIQIYTFQI